VSVGAGEDHAAGLDYEVNLKTELEIMSLHDKIDGVLAAHLAEVSQTQRELTTLSVCPESLLCPQSAQHQADHSQSDEGDRGSVIEFMIANEAAAS
jgi:uncharacterized membrane protein